MSHPWRCGPPHRGSGGRGAWGRVAPTGCRSRQRRRRGLTADAGSPAKVIPRWNLHGVSGRCRGFHPGFTLDCVARGSRPPLCFSVRSLGAAGTAGVRAPSSPSRSIRAGRASVADSQRPISDTHASPVSLPHLLLPPLDIEGLTADGTLPLMRIAIGPPPRVRRVGRATPRGPRSATPGKEPLTHGVAQVALRRGRATPRRGGESGPLEGRLLSGEQQAPPGVGQPPLDARGGPPAFTHQQQVELRRVSRPDHIGGFLHGEVGAQAAGGLCWPLRSSARSKAL